MRNGEEAAHRFQAYWSKRTDWRTSSVHGLTVLELRLSDARKLGINSVFLQMRFHGANFVGPMSISASILLLPHPVESD